MYECGVFEYGETIDCKNKAQCLEVMVSEKQMTEILFSNISHWQGTWHCKDGKCREMLDFQCERWKEKRTVSFHKKHQSGIFDKKKLFLIFQTLQRHCLWPVSPLDGWRLDAFWGLSVGQPPREWGDHLDRWRRSFSSGNFDGKCDGNSGETMLKIPYGLNGPVDPMNCNELFLSPFLVNCALVFCPGELQRDYAGPGWWVEQDLPGWEIHGWWKHNFQTSTSFGRQWQMM